MKAIVGYALAAALLCAEGCSAKDALRPEMIRWGASAAEIEAALEGKCAKGFVNRPIEPPFLPVVKDRQVQIDCDGLDFLGAPRWAEFVIGDDRLQMVWIMVEEKDRETAIKALAVAYGPPSSTNSDYIAFSKGWAAWREQPPEILFYAPELHASLEPDFTPDP